MEDQKRIKIKALLALASLSEEIVVKGWVRTKRGSKNAVFIAMNDGSTIHNIQVVADPELFGRIYLNGLAQELASQLQVFGWLRWDLVRPKSCRQKL